MAGYIHNFDPTDIVGQTFGRLKVLEYTRKELVSYRSKQSHYKYYYKCQCSCKEKTIFYAIRQDLLKGDTKSCGCLKHEFAKNIFKTHGMTNTYFYKKWLHMKSRCNYEGNNRYHNYGGRGITYDPKWEQFEGFYEDMYESYCKHVEEYGERNTTLDRIDHNKNYSKENCRWATYIEQENNKTNTRYNDYDNKSLTYRDIYDNYLHDNSVTYEIFCGRCQIGWDIDKALVIPAKTEHQFLFNNEYLTIKELVEKYNPTLPREVIHSRLKGDKNNRYHYGDHIFNPKLFQKDLSQPYCPIKIINNTDSK